MHSSHVYGSPGRRKMRPFFNLCIPCSLQIVRRNQLCLHLRMVSFCILISWGALLLCFTIASGVSVCQILQSPKSIVLLYAILLTSCIFPLDLNSFSVKHYNTVIFLCLSMLLGLHRGWLHNSSEIKLVIDLIWQCINVVWFTLQMTLYTSWNWISC